MGRQTGVKVRNMEHDLLIHGGRSHHGGQVAALLHILPVVGNDDVTMLDAALVGRTVRDHVGDQGALILFHIQCLGQLRGDGLDLAPEVAAGDLAVSASSAKELGTAGGEAAVKEPWRVGLGILLDLYGEAAADLDLELVREYGEHLPLLMRMKETGLNTPLPSSLGRLFDAAAALCGLRFGEAYEGQAAIELEQAMERLAPTGYQFTVIEEDGQIILDWRGALGELVDDVVTGADPAQVSARFHAGLIQGLADWAQAGSEASGLSQACLGGGCLLNSALLTNLPRLLKDSGLEVFTPQALPAGDGGLCLGQALAGAAAWERGLNVDEQTILGPSGEELEI